MQQQAQEFSKKLQADSDYLRAAYDAERARTSALNEELTRVNSR